MAGALWSLVDLFHHKHWALLGVVLALAVPAVALAIGMWGCPPRAWYCR